MPIFPRSQAVYTPPPWRWHDHGGRESWSLRRPDGQPVLIPAFVARHGLSDPSQLAAALALRKIAIPSIAVGDKDAALIAAAPNLLTELTAYHDREWRTGHERLPAHTAGEFPDQCGACTVIAKATA